MSKTRKIISLIIGIIVILLGFSTTVQASYKDVRNNGRIGGKYYISHSEYNKPNSPVWCLEHTEGAPEGYFILKNIITIVGDKATNANGREKTNWRNAKLAYIVSQSNANVKGGAKGDGYVQHTIWNYMKEWLKNVGSSLGVDTSISNGVTCPHGEHNVEKKAKEYADNMENGEITNNTVQSNLKEVIEKVDNVTYRRIGPFNLSFSGTLSMEVSDEKGVVAPLYAKYNASTKSLNFVNVSDIKTGENFYVYVNTARQSEKITVTAKASAKVRTAKLWFLRAVDSTQQNLMVTRTNTQTVESSVTIPYTPEPLGGLFIRKSDATNSSKLLSGVQFVLYNKKEKKYIGRSSTGALVWVGLKRNAEVYTTVDGYVTIQNIPIGNYEIQEIKTAPGYKLEIVGQVVGKVQIFRNTLATKTVTNKPDIPEIPEIPEIPDSGTIKIIKEDKDNPSKKLSNVTFVLYNEDKKGYLATEVNTGNKIFVGDKNLANKYTTQNGEVTITNVPKGKYTIYETTNTNQEYRLIVQGVSANVEVSKTTQVTIQNELKKAKLIVIKQDSRNPNVKLQGVTFKFRNQATGEYVRRDEAGNITYVDEANATIFTTDANGQISVDKLKLGTYEAQEVSNPNIGYEDAPLSKETITLKNDNEEIRKTVLNQLQPGSLKIIKRDNISKAPLSGVQFIVQFNRTGKFVNRNSAGAITYVDRAQATTFTTNNNGEISISNLIKGSYTITETKAKDGYKPITDGRSVTVQTGQTSQIEIPNEQIYIKLSGYVWVDEPDGKLGSERTELFKDPDTPSKANPGQFIVDTKDRLLDGITVRLRDRSRGGAIVQQTQTSALGKYTGEQGHDGHGEYEFSNVLIEKLKDYYVEFEYNGLTYESITPYINENNGSKASEVQATRNALNNNFASVEGSSSQDQQVRRTSGITRKADGSQGYNLSYSISNSGHEATLLDQGQYVLTSNTDTANYLVNQHYTAGQSEIRNINLGLKTRLAPDIAIVKDLENVRLAVNGKEHTYVYSQRFLNQAKYGDGFNIGVKFATGTNTYGGITYTRAIYKSDYDYENPQDNSKELKAYITYRIKIRNKSANGLKVRVNSIIEYFDSRYEIKAVGTSIDEKGDVVQSLSYTTPAQVYNNEYKKVVVNNITNAMDDQSTQDSIYVQFSLDKSAITNILNGRENLDNVVEINSYTTYDSNGRLYAAVDRNSAPANAVPGNKATYEDDTDSSPSLVLEIANAREMTGKVFLDSTNDNLMTGEIRQGSGVYESNEQGIGGVEITLTENTGSGKVYKTTTVTKAGTYGYNQDSNGEWYFEEVKDPNKIYQVKENLQEGDFVLAGFIPGDYTLTYTWGNEKYTVQNYKATVVNQVSHDAKGNGNNKDMKWYRDEFKQRYPTIEWDQATNKEIRRSDATDDINLRKAIDEELKKVTNSSKTTISKMNSTTPEMEFGVEYETAYTASLGDRYTYRVNSIDFGIVERARQQIQLTKRIKNLKLTLASGQVISDLEIDENRNVTGNSNHVTYMAPSPNLIYPRNGYIKAELDNELIQGATINVGYSIKIVNNGEKDYDSEKYYKYGTVDGQETTITPSIVLDYLDNEWAFSEEANQQWKIKTLEEIKPLIAQEVYGTGSTIGEKKIIQTESLAKPLKTTESVESILNVSKQLSTTDEISLDNETEIAQIDKTGGSTIPTIPGNYIPGQGHTEDDDDMAETTIITPSTGENRDYIIPVVIGIVSLAIIGTGIVIIKKKTIQK